MEETWKDSSCVGYQVSNLGRFRSVERILNPHFSRTQRYGVVSTYSESCRISKAGNRIPHRLYVHVEVARAFIGERPVGLQINHIDGNKRNNRSNNLEYVTAKENAHHALRLGLTQSAAGSNNPGVRFRHLLPRGVNSHQAKLTEAQVLEIRAKYNGTTVGYRTLAKEYGVSHPSIASIVKRKGWSHLA